MSVCTLLRQGLPRSGTLRHQYGAQYQCQSREQEYRENVVPVSRDWRMLTSVPRLIGLLRQPEDEVRPGIDQNETDELEKNKGNDASIDRGHRD